MQFSSLGSRNFETEEIRAEIGTCLRLGGNVWSS
jgi:hypothetical protein